MTVDLLAALDELVAMAAEAQRKLQIGEAVTAGSALARIKDTAADYARWAREDKINDDALLQSPGARELVRARALKQLEREAPDAYRALRDMDLVERLPPTPQPVGGTTP